MAPPPKTDYRYDPNQDTSTIGSFIKGQGSFRFPQGISTAEKNRRVLQDRAVALIEESLADAEANIDMATLAPIVMAALDDPDVTDDDIIKSIQLPFGIEKKNSARRSELQAALEQRPAPTSPAPASGTESGGSKTDPVLALRGLLSAAAEAVADATTPEERATAALELQTLSRTYKDVADLAEGNVTLQDGTIITSAMLNNPDPVVAQQYQQAFADRATAIENENAAVMNAYNMQGYNAQRASVADQNSNAIAQYNAQMASIRERLARDQIDITRASTEIRRALEGMQESRSRTELETKTALEVAPWATSGGKTEFSGDDLGGALAQLQRQGGGNSSQPIVKFPGTITIDPTAAMAKRDAELGVTGPLAEVPKLSVTDADIPRGVALQGYGHIQMPTLTAPKPRQVIQMPAQRMPGEYE